MKTWVFAAAATLAVVTPVWSHGALDAGAIKLYGGTYSFDCSNPAAPHLRVAADALTVEQGTKRTTGRNVQTAYSYFGQSPPPNYEVALTGEVTGGLALVFIVYRDKSERYITLGGADTVEAALGKALLQRKYRLCGDVIKKAAPAPAVVTEPEPIVLPHTLLKDARFKSAYYTALGPRIKQDWLAKLEGPGSPLDKITIGGKEYTLASVCKDHDCGDNNVVLLYSPAQGVVFGKILDQRRAIVIGAPPPPVAAELERLWIAQWRQRP
jgi:hypothetical protein